MAPNQVSNMAHVEGALRLLREAELFVFDQASQAVSAALAARAFG